MEPIIESDSNTEAKRKEDLERNEIDDSNKNYMKTRLQTTEITKAANSKYQANLLRDIDVAFERESSSRLVSINCKVV